MRELSCTDCMELCPDVALGIADAQDRASVLAHVEGCRGCHDELASLSETADLLPLLIPSVEPSGGFAPRVVRAVSRSSRAEPVPLVPPSHRRPVRLLSVAAAVVIAAAVGLGAWLAGGGSSGPSAPVESASLLAGHHRAVGQVMIVPAKKPWISVAVNLAGGGSDVRCKVESVNGNWQTVGSFELYRGWGYWAAPLPRGDVIRGAELLSSGGQVLATASFTST